MRGRGLTEVTVCMYVQYFQQSIVQPGIVPNPARGQPARENDGFPAAVRASVHSFSTLRLNL